MESVAGFKASHNILIVPKSDFSVSFFPSFQEHIIVGVPLIIFFGLISLYLAAQLQVSILPTFYKQLFCYIKMYLFQFS